MMCVLLYDLFWFAITHDQSRPRELKVWTTVNVVIVAACLGIQLLGIIAGWDWIATEAMCLLLVGAFSVIDLIEISTNKVILGEWIVRLGQ